MEDRLLLRGRDRLQGHDDVIGFGEGGAVALGQRPSQV
jgi:hypothetical protein